MLFGQDIHGPFILIGDQIKVWHQSMLELLDYGADILCEGHAGVIEPDREVRSFIQGFIKQYC